MDTSMPLQKPSPTLLQYFKDLVAQVDHLKGVVLTDADGVPMLSESEPQLEPILHEPALSASFVQAVDKVTRLGLGDCQTSVCICSRHQFIHFNFNPVYCVLVADENAHTGQLLALRLEIGQRLQRLQKKVSRLTIDSTFSAPGATLPAQLDI
ncbi:Ragulator complex protein lamtor3 [Dispira parvispora]|uniref:Ragulator complex protein lamtor3 n=1 Tax=Dispira parvispora TaxID=1520584 RepID=A0A9W8AS07_9FUNG|nr:Ragulator complex protein lamtor3 [Dispira parvispora]